MNNLLPLRPSAVMFGLLVSLIALKEPAHLASSVTAAGISLLFLAAMLNVFICLAMALAASFVLPSLFPKQWRAPNKDVFPLNVWGEPVNFLHWGATAFIALGASGLLLGSIKWGVASSGVLLLFLIVGLGTMAGVKLAPYVFRGRVA